MPDDVRTDGDTAGQYSRRRQGTCVHGEDGCLNRENPEQLATGVGDGLEPLAIGDIQVSCDNRDADIERWRVLQHCRQPHAGGHRTPDDPERAVIDLLENVFGVVSRKADGQSAIRCGRRHSHG